MRPTHRTANAGTLAPSGARGTARVAVVNSAVCAPRAATVSCLVGTKAGNAEVNSAVGGQAVFGMPLPMREGHPTNDCHARTVERTTHAFVSQGICKGLASTTSSLGNHALKGCLARVDSALGLGSGVVTTSGTAGRTSKARRNTLSAHTDTPTAYLVATTMAHDVRRDA